MSSVKCRLFGHDWPKLLTGIMSHREGYVRIGKPTYWTVQSCCVRDGCRAARTADIAGVNPKLGIPWGRVFEMTDEQNDVWERRKRFPGLCGDVGMLVTPLTKPIQGNAFK